MENGKKYWCGVYAGIQGTIVISGIEELHALQPKLEALGLKLGLEEPVCKVNFSDLNELEDNEKQPEAEETTTALNRADESGQR